MDILSTQTTKNSSVKIQNENADDYPIMKVSDAGRTIWIQAADPAGSSVNGDVWIKLP